MQLKLQLVDQVWSPTTERANKQKLKS